MSNIVFAAQVTQIDRRLCLVELGIGWGDSIGLVMQSTSCGRMLEFFASWDASEHACVNLTGRDNKPYAIHRNSPTSSSFHQRQLARPRLARGSLWPVSSCERSNRCCEELLIEAKDKRI